MEILNDIRLPLNDSHNELQRKILGDLTIKNPAYEKAIRLNKSVYNLQEHIKLFRIADDKIIIPRGYGRQLLKRFKETGTGYMVDNRRLLLPEVNFNSRITLRGYQVPAVDALVKGQQGGIVAGCGSGKTVILLEAISRIRQPALWICHTYELLEQTKERACEAFGMAPEEIGVVADGKVRIGDKLTLALIQTLSRVDMQDLKNRFGCVCVDEAHHMAAKSFYDTVGQFPARYRLWASATPERQDGLTQMVYVTGGPVLHEINMCELPTITPELRVIKTGYKGYRFSADEYTKIISDITKNEPRNRLIVETIAAEAQGNYSLVLSDRVAHLRTLKDMLKSVLPGLSIEILTASGMSKKQRAAVMENVKNKQVDIVLATQLAREGLDILHLNRLYLCTPKRAAGAVQQEVGRIMRPCEGKHNAIVFDFWDSQCPILKGQFWARRAVYKKLGMI
jgi:superfamily II DNA or RNA helicase